MIIKFTTSMVFSTANIIIQTSPFSLQASVTSGDDEDDPACSQQVGHIGAIFEFNLTET